MAHFNTREPRKRSPNSQTRRQLWTARQCVHPFCRTAKRDGCVEPSVSEVRGALTTVQKELFTMKCGKNKGCNSCFWHAENRLQNSWVTDVSNKYITNIRHVSRQMETQIGNHFFVTCFYHSMSQNENKGCDTHFSAIMSLSLLRNACSSYWPKISWVGKSWCKVFTRVPERRVQLIVEPWVEDHSLQGGKGCMGVCPISPQHFFVYLKEAYNHVPVGVLRGASVYSLKWTIILGTARRRARVQFRLEDFNFAVCRQCDAVCARTTAVRGWVWSIWKVDQHLPKLRPLSRWILWGKFCKSSL